MAEGEFRMLAGVVVSILAVGAFAFWCGYQAGKEQGFLDRWRGRRRG